MTKLSFTSIVLLAALYTGSVEAKICAGDKEKFGCFPKNGECRVGGFPLERPCNAPEQAPINQYNCYGELGGQMKAIFGPRSLRAKVYERLPITIQYSSNVDPEVKALIARWTAECRAESGYHGCYIRCIKQ